MGASYVLLLFLSFFWPRDRAPGPALAERTRSLVCAALCVALCAAALCERVVLEAIDRAQTPLPAWFAALPIHYLTGISSESQTLITLAQMCAGAQAAGLFGLYMTLRRPCTSNRVPWIVLGATACVLTIIAFAANTMGTDDLYLYVGSALASPSPYHPGPIPFPGQDAAINRMWFVPLFPSAYGPLWIAISRFAIAFAHGSLLAQLTALRCVQLIALGVCVAALARARRPIATIALVLVNPALYQLYVTDGHNDLTAIAFTLLAALTVANLWISIPLAVAAGLIKLPFMLLAAVVYAVPGWSFARRATPAALVIALTVTVSTLWAGPDYYASMKHVYKLSEFPTPALETAVRTALRAFAIVALVLAVAWRRFPPGAPWTFATLGQFPLQQYLCWGLPYAIVAENAGSFLAMLPVVNYFVATEFDNTRLMVAARLAVCMLLGFTGCVTALRRFRGIGVPVTRAV